ncbi:MAG: DUF4249 family protein [Bacteroidetes bacterium]|nr:DUF4249 family protein [Bacteroidota bacterium]MDE2673395.1 DUF4249 family protein [Bacteroidota bacterium]
MLKVDFPNKTSLQAVSSAPPPVVISDYSIEFLSRTPFHIAYFETKYKLGITFSDTPGINFYRIGVYRLERNHYANDESDPDSVYETIEFDGLTPGWSCGYSDDVVSDPIDPGAGSGLLCEEFVVTDRLFDGGDYSWSGTTASVIDGLGRNELRLIISSLSEDYYNYLHSSERNAFYDPLTEEPFPVYSNVSGGLGVFAGYTNTYLDLPFPSE